MAIETQKPQGQDQGPFTPPGPPPIVFEDFSGGLNNDGNRAGIKDNEEWWCDGFFPIAPNYLRTIPDVGPPLYDPNTGGGGGGGGLPPRPWLWVTGQSCEVLAFAFTARNDDAPIINIQGDATNLTGPQGNDFSVSYAVAIGPDKRIYVIGGYNTVDTSTWINNLNVFAPTANGNVPPVQIISGDMTDLFNSEQQMGICVDDDNNCYVGSYNDLDRWPNGANGNVAPTILVALDISEYFRSLFFDSSTQLIWGVTTTAGFSTGLGIRSYNLSGVLQTHITGASTGLTNIIPTQIFLDSSGNIYIASASEVTFDDQVYVWNAGANGNVAPDRSFTQTLWVSTPTAYQGIALDGNGNAYMSATTGEDSGLPGSNNRTVQVVPASSSGTVAATGVMTNVALRQMDDTAGTTPVQMAIG